MASVPSRPKPVLGRLDRTGRLISADPALAELQRDAGSELGELLALPQIASIADLAQKLGTAVTRPAIAASRDQDIELSVHAVPDGDEIALTLDDWTARPAAGPRLAAILGGAVDAASPASRNQWSADEELRLISISRDLAELLGVEPEKVAGQPLTRIVRLEEDDSGDMPLISALAARRSFSGQRARSRSDDSRSVVLSGEVVTGAEGHFAGFRGSVESDKSPGSAPLPARTEAFDEALDEILRSPLDRIIESAEQIMARSEGPLRSDYATYGADIAGAARHLLSVLKSMNEGNAELQKSVDLTALAAKAIVMVEAQADARSVTIVPRGDGPLPAQGERRGVIQILVNLMGNAIRHSPEGGTIELQFRQSGSQASLSVCDSGPGVPAADQERIFERFESAHPGESGSGLGLAISRRLARSMGGDVTLESAPGEGARFTLTLPGV